MQQKTTERSDDLRQWILQPFADLRDRAARLPAQTERLARQVGLLEVLLDLEIAAIGATLGEIPQAQARTVGARVAAAVLLPELAHRLAEARRAMVDHRRYRERLDAGRAAGDVPEAAYAALRPQYLANEARSTATVHDLEAQAQVWRRDGRRVLDDCDAWLRLELDGRRSVAALA